MIREICYASSLIIIMLVVFFFPFYFIEEVVSIKGTISLRSIVDANLVVVSKIVGGDELEGIGLIFLLLPLLGIFFFLKESRLPSKLGRIISYSYNTPFKRLAFVILCVPLIISVIPLFLTPYFYYKTYYSANGEDSCYHCHERLAIKEIGMSPKDYYDNNSYSYAGRLKKQIIRVRALAKSRYHDRLSNEVRNIESSTAFISCLKTFSWSSIHNLEWVRVELHLSFIWSIVAAFLMLFFNQVLAFSRSIYLMLLAPVKWVMMK